MPAGLGGGPAGDAAKFRQELARLVKQGKYFTSDSNCGEDAVKNRLPLSMVQTILLLAHKTGYKMRLRTSVVGHSNSTASGNPSRHKIGCGFDLSSINGHQVNINNSTGLSLTHKFIDVLCNRVIAGGHHGSCEFGGPYGNSNACNNYLKTKPAAQQPHIFTRSDHQNHIHFGLPRAWGASSPYPSLKPGPKWNDFFIWKSYAEYEREVYGKSSGGTTTTPSHNNVK